MMRPASMSRWRRRGRQGSGQRQSRAIRTGLRDDGSRPARPHDCANRLGMPRVVPACVVRAAIRNQSIRPAAGCGKAWSSQRAGHRKATPRNASAMRLEFFPARNGAFSSQVVLHIVLLNATMMAIGSRGQCHFAVTRQLEMFLGAQRQLHHALQQLLGGKADKVAQHQLLGVEAHEVA